MKEEKEMFHILYILSLTRFHIVANDYISGVSGKYVLIESQKNYY